MIESESLSPGATGTEAEDVTRVRITVRQIDRRGKALPGGASWQITLGGIKLRAVMTALQTLTRKWQ